MSAASSQQTCVILAGGLGTRLRSVIADLPKCLAPVGTRTFLAVQLEGLARAGVTDAVISIGYQAQLVVESVEKSPPPMKVRFVREEQPLGTGGAIGFAMDSLDLTEVLVANGDTYLDGDLSRMFQPLDEPRGEMLRMATVAVADRFRFGGVQVDAGGLVQRFLEKGEHGAGLINAGLYRLSRAALPAARTGAYSLETEVLPSLVQAARVTATTIVGSFTDIGVPADYKAFCDQHAA